MASEQLPFSRTGHAALPAIANQNKKRKRQRPLRRFLRRINYRRVAIHILVTFIVGSVLGPLQLTHLLPTPPMIDNIMIDVQTDDFSRGMILAPPPSSAKLIAKHEWIRMTTLEKTTTNNSSFAAHQFRAFMAKPPEIQNEEDTKAGGIALVSPAQLRRLISYGREERYVKALEQLRNADLRRHVDPLSEHNFIEATPANRIPILPKSKYLGILVDAGRHYYPIPWLKRLIHYLYRLRFNLIHFRLTDDQAFNLQLESYPELSLASATANSTYTARELRDLVAYAKQYDISIIPEVNLPGHAGAWSGIPGMILHCPTFACRTGYGIPMNVEYAQMKAVLKGVIGEVLDIFDNPPFLHLGGDEVHKSKECFTELGQEPFQYDAFELQLEEVLQEIGYPMEQVIRWEVTGPHASIPHARAGKIQHNWYYLPGEKLEINPNHTYFNSWRLYMDANNDDGAAQIYRNTLSNFQRHKEGTDHIPNAIVPAAFELDTDLWMHRNVAARLIAVAMGAAHLNLKGPEETMQVYEKACRDMGLHPTICDLQGFTAVPIVQYRKDWQTVWRKWIEGTCARIGAL